MSIKPFTLVCAAVFAASFLFGCEQSVRRLEEPPELLRVETDAVPAPEARVAQPEAKTALCPDCAARLKGPARAVPVYRSGPRSEAPPLADIYFDYDKHAITPAAARILRNNAAWFRANPGVRVRVEGYCDERGTGKYNVRLGQQRAEAAKNFLVKLGVNRRLLEVSTYGSDKPDPSDHNLQAWAKNRKVHFEPIQ